MSKTTKLFTRIETVSWRSLKTNPYNQPLAGQMLKKGGFVVTKKVKLKGSTQYDNAEEVRVVYDRDYFQSKLRHTLLNLLEDGLTLVDILHEVKVALTGNEEDTGIQNLPHLPLGNPVSGDNKAGDYIG